MANPIKLQAQVSKILTFGAGVYKVHLKPLSRVPRYKAGQFLHLTVDSYDPSGGFWPESRVFSIASNFSENELCIVYSVKGQYTKKMEATLVEGGTVWLKLPYGDFIIDHTQSPENDIVLIAGGTGVSPYIPYISSLAENPSSEKRIHFYYGARLCSNILFADLIDLCAAKVQGFKTTIQIENESSSNLHLDNVTKKDGRLDIEKILNETKELRKPVFFLSGPPVMIKAFKQKLMDNNIQPSNIKIDEWE